MSEEEALANRNMNLTVFIGQPFPITPNIQMTTYAQDDIFILCSDGLWSLVQPDEIFSTVQKHRQREQLCRFNWRGNGVHRTM